MSIDFCILAPSAPLAAGEIRARIAERGWLITFLDESEGAFLADDAPLTSYYAVFGCRRDSGIATAFEAKEKPGDMQKFA